ncbi:unnamed protein product, partial [Darwinula stevensoni]
MRSCCRWHLFLPLVLLLYRPSHSRRDDDEEERPRFAQPLGNQTVVKGRNTTFCCVIDNVGKYKVAWAHEGRQMVLVVDDVVATKIPRFGTTHSHDRTVWRLHVHNVQESDQGYYMCQLNTEPMMKQRGLLHVLVPPEISDEASSPSRLQVVEHSEAILLCAGQGKPPPNISWRREDDAPIHVNKSLRGQNS